MIITKYVVTLGLTRSNFNNLFLHDSNNEGGKESTTSDLADLNKNLLAVNLQVANCMHNEDSHKIDQLSLVTMEGTKKHAMKRQFNKLLTLNKIRSKSDMLRAIINPPQ